MILKDKHKCKYCGEEFEWFYQVPQKMECRLFDVETWPEGKVRLYRIGRSIERNGYLVPLNAEAYCPKCNRLNYIEIEKQCL